MSKQWNGVRKWITNLSLRKKLLASFLLVLMLSMTMLCIYAVKTSYENAIYHTDVSVTGMVANAQTSYLLKMEQISNLIELCIYQDDLQTVYKNAYDSYFELYIGLKKTITPLFNMVMGFAWSDVQQMIVYSSTGLSKYGTHIDSIDVIRDESWFEEAQQSTNLQWYIDGTRFFSLSPIITAEGVIPKKSYGLFYTSMNDNFLSNYLEINSPAYELRITNKQGDVLLDQYYGEWQSANDDNLLVRSFTWDSQDWLIEYLVPLESMRGTYFSFLKVNLLLVVLGTGALLVVIVLLTRTLFADVAYLHKQIQIVQQGNMDISISSDHKDEIGMLTNAFGVMIKHLCEWMEKNRATEQYAQRLENRVLRAQIDPHFLYNTLSYINWLALRSDNDDISYAVTQLSQFYRTCLNKGRDLIYVHQEIDNIKAYIRIQQLLHSDSFTVTFDEDEQLDQYMMLSFLLQPLVENAIVHGVDMCQDKRGEITVTTRLESELMHFTISDNGGGFALDENGKPLSLPEKLHGYGITNIIARIHFFYGEQYNLTFANRPEGGCNVMVSLPVRTGNY